MKKIKIPFLEGMRTRRRHEQAAICDKLGAELQQKMKECAEILKKYKYERARLEDMKK